jgi:hypothetical protein
MNASFTHRFALLSLVASATLFVTQAHADPLPGENRLKFDQQPMLNTPVVGPNGTVQIYHGHDELSTAYGFANAVSPTITQYDGRFMADDFADNLNSPVLHVKWWGSYLGNVINPNAPVNKFLISFESDQPAGPAPSFSRPDQPLLNQVLTLGALAPGSGTYTEKLIQAATPGSDAIYEYNGELANPFPEQKDTVYWLKIAAMVDVPAGIQFPPSTPPTTITQWGWHNRDYTINDTYASPVVSPGESLVGTIGISPVYHFQDDAVAGDVRIVTTVPPATSTLNPFISQSNYSPQFYVDGLDGPGVAGAPGISHFSKDLAFQLYTSVPEPSTYLMAISGCFGLALIRRQARR